MLAIAMLQHQEWLPIKQVDSVGSLRYLKGQMTTTREVGIKNKLPRGANQVQLPRVVPVDTRNPGDLTNVVL